MVFLDAARPVTEPRPKRIDAPFSSRRMALNELPLVVGRLALLVQNLTRHGEFADVVKDGRPSEQTLIAFAEVEFFSDDFGKCAHSFGVSSRPAVVRIQGAD